MSAKERYLSSQRANAEIIQSVTGGVSNSDCLMDIREESCDRKKNQYDANDSTLKGLVGYLIGTNQRLILSTKNTGDCLDVRGTTVTGTSFSAMEFSDFLCPSYNVTPLNLQSHCGVCGTYFQVRHSLSCSKGGLDIARLNEARDELLYLSQQAFNSASVREEPLIHQGHTRS